MYCGYMLNDVAHSSPDSPRPMEIRNAPASVPVAPSWDSAPAKGTDWAAIVAAILAFLGLRHASRRAGQTAIVIVILLLFFGCPMICGFMAFAMEWFAQLFP
jgi:hypothetical protein